MNRSLGLLCPIRNYRYVLEATDTATETRQLQSMKSLPFSAMAAIEAAVISFILSGMWWIGLDRIIGVETVALALGVVGTTAILGAVLLYLDYGPRGNGRVA